MLNLLDFFASDVLLTVFFFVVGLELVEELKNGDLRDLKRASLPALATIGGVIVPAAIYLLVMHFASVRGEFMYGWAIPTATDVAFSLVVLQFFKHKLRSGVKLFLMVLAVVDDIIGIVIIALVYSGGRGVAVPEVLLVVVLMTFWAVLLRHLKNIKSSFNQVVAKIALVLLACSVWLFVLKSGVHPTIAGVTLGLTTPATVEADGTSLATRLVKFFGPFNNLVVVPIFAVVSIVVSGAQMFNTSPAYANSVTSYELTVVVFAVVFGLVVGKPLGILLFVWIGSHLTPLELFHDLRVRNLVGAALLGGIGFTVSFLIAALSFSNELVVAFARLGVLVGSLVSTAAGSAFIYFTTRKTATSVENAA